MDEMLVPTQFLVSTVALGGHRTALADRYAAILQFPSVDRSVCLQSHASKRIQRLRAEVPSGWVHNAVDRSPAYCVAFR